MRISLLLNTLLKSKSGINILIHETDSKKKGKVIGNYVAQLILYAALMAFIIATCIGYGSMGLTDIIPALSVITVSILVFFFALFKVHGYLFAFKDYDTLMSLPFSIKDVVSSKFLYMYVKDLPWVISASVAMEIGYGVYAHPPVATYILWSVLMFVIPVLPLVIATIVGTLIAGIGSKFRFKKLITSIFTFAFIFLCFCSRFIIEDVFRNNELEETLNNVADSLSSVKNAYAPALWFENAVLRFRISDILLLLGVTLIAFEITFLVISRFYRQINSRLMTGSSAKAYKMSVLKQKSIPNSIAFKEFKHFLNSTNYLVNFGMGFVFLLIITVASLFVDFDTIIGVITQGAPVSKEMLLPAVPVIIYFFSGMVSSTCVSPSLEGKNIWILDSLPIRKSDVYKGKMLFNIYFMCPVSILACICVGIRCGANALEVLVFVICITSLNLFSTVWGMVCGLNHIKLDWENDIEVIKQGSAVAIYLFPNMFVTMGLVVGAVALGFIMDTSLICLILTVAALLLAALCYGIVMKKAK